MVDDSTNYNGHKTKVFVSHLLGNICICFTHVIKVILDINDGMLFFVIKILLLSILLSLLE